MNSVEHQVKVWLHEVVIGLNLCPFSGKPTRENRVRFQVSSAHSEEEILTDLKTEMELLDKTPVAELETTLLIIPHALHDFFDYTQFLGWAQAQLKRQGWLGVYQLASFHPDYCFAGADPADSENLTNRAPYPIIHIIREASLEQALKYFEGVDEIPDRNRDCVEALTMEQKKNLFPYLFGCD
ncbi:MAG: DUF1415 domain-containing protein [Cellvibrio sp.]